MGKYSCIAQNALGEASKDVSVSIILAPTVKVEPKSLDLKNGETASLECIIGKTRGHFEILWKDDFGSGVKVVVLKQIYYRISLFLFSHQLTRTQRLTHSPLLLNTTTNLLRVKFKTEILPCQTAV